MSALRANALVGDAAALAQLATASLADENAVSTASLLRGGRLARSSSVRQAIGNRLHPGLTRIAQLRRGSPQGTQRGDVRLPSSAVLKAPGANGEKGVLFIPNDPDFAALVGAPEARALLREYDCVVASSWSPPELGRYAAAVGLSDDPMFIGLSNVGDAEIYELLRPWFEPLPVLTCDWLDPADFQPRPRAERDIDIVMVAGWGSYKRHWLLFEALRSMRHDLRVVLVGAPNEGRTVADVRAEAHAAGVKQQVEFHDNVSVDDANALQCRARIALQLSGIEGACVAVTEAMMADTPVGMMQDAHVGAKAHVNPQTGVLLRHRQLARQVERFLERAPGFTPRAWASSHISFRQSAATLNRVLREHAARERRPWTVDAAACAWRYFRVRVADPAAATALALDVERVKTQFGIEIG